MLFMPNIPKHIWTVLPTLKKDLTDYFLNDILQNRYEQFNFIVCMKNYVEKMFFHKLIDLLYRSLQNMKEKDNAIE